MLSYRGYTGHVEFDGEAGLFHGEVLDTRDVVTFQGRSVDEIEAAFRESVDETLAFCAERTQRAGRGAWLPFSGRLMPRLPKDLHRDVFVGARRAGKSLNPFVVDRLRQTGWARAGWPRALLVWSEPDPPPRPRRLARTCVTSWKAQANVWFLGA